MMAALNMHVSSVTCAIVSWKENLIGNSQCAYFLFLMMLGVIQCSI